MKVGIFKDEQSLELFTTMCEERDKRLPSYTLETLLVSSFACLAIPFLDPTEFARNPSEQHLGRIFLFFFSNSFKSLIFIVELIKTTK